MRGPYAYARSQQRRTARSKAGESTSDRLARPPRGELQFFGELGPLNDTKAFAAALLPLRACEWFVFAKKTFPGPEQVLGYLARYTHRVAITNSRLLALDASHVTFRWKAHRKWGDHKSKVMRLEIGEFIRRFLLHVLPNGFHRIRHYGFLANGHRAQKLALCRSLLPDG